MFPPRTGRFLGSLILSLLLAAALPGADALAQLQARFDKESDAVRKAKLAIRLGSVQFQQARVDMDAGNDENAVKQFESYRDNVRAAVAALESAYTNAERHPGGYRELEEHVREALRITRDTDVAIADSVRPRLDRVRQDLEKLDDELLGRLFPRRPGEQHQAKPGPQPSMSSPPK
jgi:predicted negative regulator of RcsB-dependent stress response